MLSCVVRVGGVGHRKVINIYTRIFSHTWYRGGYRTQVDPLGDNRDVKDTSFPFPDKAPGPTGRMHMCNAQSSRKMAGAIKRLLSFETHVRGPDARWNEHFGVSLVSNQESFLFVRDSAVGDAQQPLLITA